MHIVTQYLQDRTKMIYVNVILLHRLEEWYAHVVVDACTPSSIEFARNRKTNHVAPSIVRLAFTDQPRMSVDIQVVSPQESDVVRNPHTILIIADNLLIFAKN